MVFNRTLQKKKGVSLQEICCTPQQHQENKKKKKNHGNDCLTLLSLLPAREMVS